MGYRNGIVTAPCVALNGFGKSATIVLMGTGLFGVGVVARSAGQPRVSPDLILHVFGAT